MAIKKSSRYFQSHCHRCWILHTVFVASSLLFCLSVANILNGTKDKKSMIIVKIRQNDVDSVLNNLQRDNLTLVYKITPSVYILSYNGSKNILRVLQALENRSEIKSAEQVRTYVNTLRPAVSLTEDILTGGKPNGRLHKENVYGMGIRGAWSRGYNGKGVTIAVTGMGLDTKHPDLRSRVKEGSDFNYADNIPWISSEVSPGASAYTDQGTRVAGILAGDGSACSVGIASGAQLLGIQLFDINKDDKGTRPSYVTSSDVISRALVHNIEDIDISVDPWRPNTEFEPLDLAVNEAIEYGAEMGRHGLGTVHVVPAGPVGNELSNSIHTVTVNRVRKFGIVPEAIGVDASVLTTGLRDGCNISSSSMVTSAAVGACVNNFKGIAAAVAQVGGIIALGFEASPRLSLRDVQHLLVRASDLTSVQDQGSVKTNGAGHRYHPALGFGLLDADRFVRLAECWKSVSALLQKSMDSVEMRVQAPRTQIFKFCHSCDVIADATCLTTVEHVSLLVNFKTDARDFSMELVSPHGTKSVLIDLEPQPHQDESAYTTLTKARFVSLHFWDEIGLGTWQLSVHSENDTGESRISKVTLTLHGTRNESVASDSKMVSSCGKDTGLDPQGTTEAPKLNVQSSGAQTDTGEKKNIVIFVVIGIGAVIGVGLVCFIFMRGGQHIPVSTVYKARPLKKVQAVDVPIDVTSLRPPYTSLHLRIGLLVQRQESVQEDFLSETEEADT